jgi:hypothetical protein
MEKGENKRKIKEKGKGILYLMGRQPGIRPNLTMDNARPTSLTARALGFLCG